MKWILRLIKPVVLPIIATGLAHIAIYLLNKPDWHRCVHALYSIHYVCTAYAASHEGKFPDGKSSNEAFRQFFVVGYMDDEIVFSYFDHPLSKSDGNIGTEANGYLEALAPGECPMTYVRGLTTDQKDPLTPLVFLQLVGSDGEIYLPCVTVGLKVKVYPTTNGAVLEEHEGKTVDIFSEAYLKEKYGIEPQDILKPEGPPRDLTAIAKARKRHLHTLEAGILALIWLPFPLTVWIRHRRSARLSPEKTASEP